MTRPRGKQPVQQIASPADLLGQGSDQQNEYQKCQESRKVARAGSDTADGYDSGIETHEAGHNRSHERQQRKEQEDKGPPNRADRPWIDDPAAEIDEARPKRSAVIATPPMNTPAPPM